MVCAGDPEPLPGHARRRARGAAGSGRRARPPRSASQPRDLVLRDRHRGAGARRRPRDHRRAHPDRARGRPRHPGRAPRRVRARPGSTTPGSGSSPSSSSRAVEFDHAAGLRLRPRAARELSAVLDDEPGLVFEAHSTDYQTARRARRAGARPLGRAQGRARPHLRPARGALRPRRDRGRAAPRGRALRLVECSRSDARRPAVVAGLLRRATRRSSGCARRYSYSDRSRYYWPAPAVAAAPRRLLDNLEPHRSRCRCSASTCPSSTAASAPGGSPTTPARLAVDRVRDVLRDYARACGAGRKRSHDRPPDPPPARAGPPARSPSSRAVWRELLASLRADDAPDRGLPGAAAGPRRPARRAHRRRHLGVRRPGARARPGPRAWAAASTPSPPPTSSPTRASCFAEDVPDAAGLLRPLRRQPGEPGRRRAGRPAAHRLHHLVLTCNPDGALFAPRHASRTGALALLMPAATNDRGFAMTSSFTSMMLAALHVLGGHRRPRPAGRRRRGGAARPGEARRRPGRRRASDRFVYLGSGPLTGARPRVRAQAARADRRAGGRATSTPRWASGTAPSRCSTTATTALVYLSNDPYTRALRPRHRRASCAPPCPRARRDGRRGRDDARRRPGRCPGLADLPDEVAAPVAAARRPARGAGAVARARPRPGQPVPGRRGQPRRGGGDHP